MSESILIRPCYLVVLEKLEALGDDFGLVISGSPGIGKSAMIVLLLHYLAKRGARVAYRYIDVWRGDTIVYFDFLHISSIVVKKASVNTVGWSALFELTGDDSVWRIEDGQAPRAQSLATGRHIVLSSPNPDNFKEFAKGNGYEIWWLPVWTPEELQRCRRLLFPHVSEQLMESRYLEFGGLIRFVLANQNASFKNLAATLSAEQAFSLYHLTRASTVRSDIRDVFVHIAVDDNLHRTGYFLGSPAIKELVFVKSQAGQWQDLVEMLHAGAKKKDLSRLSGDALETYGHAILLGGLELDNTDIRQTFRQGLGPPKQTQETDLEQTQSIAEIKNAFRGPKVLVMDSPSNVYDFPELTHTYVQPITATNGSWDSLIFSGGPTVNAIQFTRNTRHGTSAVGIQILLRRLRASGKKLRIVHAVPAEVYDEFAWQPWVGERAVERKNEQGIIEIVSKVGTLSEKQVPIELKGIEQWVVKLRLPEPGSDIPNLTRVIYNRDTAITNLSEIYNLEHQKRVSKAV